MTPTSIILPASMPSAISKGHGKWLTQEPWPFTIICGNTRIEAEVRKGFITDLFSVPWGVDLFIPRDEADDRPALAHDWLFATLGLRKDANSPSLLGLADCNQVLSLAMQACGFSSFAHWAIFTGVKLGSWKPWNDLKERGFSLANPCLN